MVRIKLSHREGVIHHNSGSKKGNSDNNESDGVGLSANGIYTPVEFVPFHCTTSHWEMVCCLSVRGIQLPNFAYDCNLVQGECG